MYTHQLTMCQDTAKIIFESGSFRHKRKYYKGRWMWKKDMHIGWCKGSRLLRAIRNVTGYTGVPLAQLGLEPSLFFLAWSWYSTGVNLYPPHGRHRHTLSYDLIAVIKDTLVLIVVHRIADNCITLSISGLLTYLLDYDTVDLHQNVTSSEDENVNGNRIDAL